MPALVGLLGAVLVAASPERPGVAVRLVAAGFGDGGPAELSQQFGHGDRDQPGEVGAAVAGALPGGGHGEEGIGEQADRGPAVPGGPGGDLSAVQPGGLLGQLVVFLDSPAGDGYRDEPAQRDRGRGPAQEVADGAGVAVPAEQQDAVAVVLAFGGVVRGDLDHRPVVVLGSLGGRAGAHPLPHGGFDQAGCGFHGEAAA